MIEPASFTAFEYSAHMILRYFQFLEGFVMISPYFLEFPFQVLFCNMKSPQSHCRTSYLRLKTNKQNHITKLKRCFVFLCVRGQMYYLNNNTIHNHSKMLLCLLSDQNHICDVTSALIRGNHCCTSTVILLHTSLT